VALREGKQIEVTNVQGTRFSVRLWPLDSPEVAACMLVTVVPKNLELLTRRERDILEMLSSGTETREIAKKFDLSVSTIHTHMKRARVKPGLRSVESLISFAGRYCYPGGRALSERSRPADLIRAVHAGRSSTRPGQRRVQPRRESR
jgi:DNA-binding CsgD family transcriptional regulator